MRTERALVKSIALSNHKSTDHPIFGGLLWQAADDILRTEERLQAKANSIADDMIQLARRLAQDKGRPYVNSLGELRGRGSELDRLCGILYRTYENFDRLYAAWDDEGL